MTKESSISNDLIHVDSYIRSDGTQVDEYYRHRKGEGTFSIQNNSTKIDVPNVVSNVLNVVGDGKKFEQECPALATLFGGVNKYKMNANAEAPDGGVVIEGGIEVIRVVLDKVVEIAKIALDVVIRATPIAAAVYSTYLAGKSAYNKISGFFDSEESQVQIQYLNTSIQGLRETQNLQKKSINRLSKEAVNTKNKEEYSNLVKALAELNAEYKKNEALICKIEYAAKEQDYGKVAEGLNNYYESQKNIIDDVNSSESSATKSYLDKAFDYPEQEFPYKLEDAHRDFGDNSLKSLNLGELQSSSDEQLQSLPDNSLLKEFLNSNNKMQGTANFNQNPQSFLPDEVNKLLEDEPNIVENKITLSAQVQKDVVLTSKSQYLPTKYYRLALNDLKTIGTIDNDNYSVKLDYIGNPTIKNFIIDKHNASENTDVVIPKIGSQLSQKASKSFELKSLIKHNFEAIKNNTFKDKSLGLIFKQTQELHLTIGKSELYNPQINKDGSFNGFIIDKYDFSELKSSLNEGAKKAGVTFINNNAYLQQQYKLVNNYVIIVPVRIEKTDLDKILYGR